MYNGRRSSFLSGEVIDDRVPVISVRCGERSGVLRFEDLIAGAGVPDPSLLGEPPSADAPHRDQARAITDQPS
jgi:hypothetical protein